MQTHRHLCHYIQRTRTDTHIYIHQRRIHVYHHVYIYMCEHIIVEEGITPIYTYTLIIFFFKMTKCTLQKHFINTWQFRGITAYFKVQGDSPGGFHQKYGGGGVSLPQRWHRHACAPTNTLQRHSNDEARDVKLCTPSPPLYIYITLWQDLGRLTAVYEQSIRLFTSLHHVTKRVSRPGGRTDDLPPVSYGIFINAHRPLTIHPIQAKQNTAAMSPWAR